MTDRNVLSEARVGEGGEDTGWLADWVRESWALSG
jgi:hypothetical protein